MNQRNLKTPGSSSEGLGPTLVYCKCDVWLALGLVDLRIGSCRYNDVRPGPFDFVCNGFRRFSEIHLRAAQSHNFGSSLRPLDKGPDNLPFTPGDDATHSRSDLG